jgi:hypothetical protein
MTCDDDEEEEEEEDDDDDDDNAIHSERNKLAYIFPMNNYEHRTSRRKALMSVPDIMSFRVNVT